MVKTSQAVFTEDLKVKFYGQTDCELLQPFQPNFTFYNLPLITMKMGQILPFTGTTSFSFSGLVTKANVTGSSSTVLSNMILFIDQQKSMFTSFSKTCM